MADLVTEGMYLFFSIPLGLANLIGQVIFGTQANPNTPQIPTQTAPRMWFSQPRPAVQGNVDPTTEVVNINFKQPLSVSELGFDALRVGCHVEVWYQDRQNNWRQVLDESRIPVALDLSASAAQSWYKAHFFCYPIVAKALQFRFRRIYDPTVGLQPYCVGMRNGLIRRNIYTRTDGTMGIEPQQDPLGNTFTSYIKDWDASKAFDDDPVTYWKSMPQPDPSAVVSLYLDCRTPGGGPQLIDTLYLDPVYSGQPLNLYYSNDDTQGTRKLSPIGAVPVKDENSQWQKGRGRWDIGSNPPVPVGPDPGLSDYEFIMNWGPLVSQDTWIGIEWTPDFAGAATDEQQVITVNGTPGGGSVFTLTYGGGVSTAIAYNASAATVQGALNTIPALSSNISVAGSAGGPWTVTYINALAFEDTLQLVPDNTNMLGGSTVSVATTVPGDVGGAPPDNPVLFQVNPEDPPPGQFWPRIYYDVGAGAIALEITDVTGTTTQTYSCPLSPTLVKYQPLRIVVGWGYDPKTVFISVKTPNGAEIGHSSTAASALPPLMTLDGSVGFVGFRGLFTAHVVKLENWSVGQSSFQANPQVYVSPDPVLPDPSGNIPATTLDNAIYAAAWTVQEHGTGGDHETRYTDKTWTPIWDNYYSQQGNMFFPQQIRLKYLKLEFTHLTEEPYPVYDSGIQVSYKVFPVSVTSAVTTKHPGLLGTALGLLTVGADVVLGGIASVNFLNPATINNAVNSVFGQVIQPVSVTTGSGQIFNSLPNTTNLDVAAQTRQELSSPYVYKRAPANATTLAANQLAVTTGHDTGQGLLGAIGNVVGTTLDNVADSFTPLINFASNPTGLPSQGADWWIFPGATLRLPSIIMNGLTAITETILGRPPTTVRQRFNTTSVHRYVTKTVTRDAAVGYFAGVREVQPYVTTYIASLDPPSFNFSSYDPSQWVLTNTIALDSGPISTAGDNSTAAIPAVGGVSTTYLINGNFDIDISNWDQAQGVWSWDSTKGHYTPGSAKVTANTNLKELVSNAIDVVPGNNIDASVWVNWTGLAATASSEAIQLQAWYYNSSNIFVSSQAVGITNVTWPATTPTVGGTSWTQIAASHAASTGFVVPSGISTMKLALVVTAAATAGQVNFDTVLWGTSDTVMGTAFKDFITTSTFTKIKCEFTDSGVVRSDSMWAQADPHDTNISSTALAYYTSTIPDVIPAGMWGDTFADWDDATITWGAPRAVVAINVDPDRIYDNKRVLHFTRAGGAEEAGIKVIQSTNFVSNGLFRIGAVFFKPTANSNQVTVRLRRVSDGVYIHEETFDPVVGYWYEYVTNFIEIPDSDNQEYTVELVCTGDDPDEFFLNNLYCEISPIRYFVRLGGADAFLHDVTQLRYADSAIVSTTDPVNEFSIQVVILSPKAYAYSARATPVYLK